MKQKLVYMVLLLGMVMGLASCDNYLNIEPKGKRIPKSLADYEAFLRYEYGTHRMPVLQTCYLLNDEYLTNSYASYYPMYKANYNWEEKPIVPIGTLQMRVLIMWLMALSIPAI